MIFHPAFQVQVDKMITHGIAGHKSWILTLLLSLSLAAFTPVSWAALKAPVDAGAELSATKYSLSLNITKMSLHLGELFKLRVVNTGNGSTVTEYIIQSLAEPDFSISLGNILDEGSSYNVDFFADHNNNKLYDPPPLDHSWRLKISNVSGPVVLDWAHPGDLGDIQYPDPGGIGNPNQGGGGSNPGTNPETDPLMCNCDLNGDTRVNIADVIKWLLDYRAGVTNQCLDLDSDGSIMINDIITLLRRMRDGTCAAQGQAGLAALAADSYLQGSAVLGLSDDEVNYIEKMTSLLNLEAKELEALDLALHGGAGGSGLPQAFSLAPNFPNPFNPATTISFAVPEGSGGGISLKVYDIRGRLVRTLVEGEHAPGSYSVFWDGRDETGASTSSGVYFYRLTAGDFAATRKMVLLK